MEPNYNNKFNVKVKDKIFINANLIKLRNQ